MLRSTLLFIRFLMNSEDKLSIEIEQAERISRDLLKLHKQR